MSLPAYTPLHEFLDDLSDEDARALAEKALEQAFPAAEASGPRAEAWHAVRDILEAYALGVPKVPCVLCPYCVQVVAFAELPEPSRRVAVCRGCARRVLAQEAPMAAGVMGLQWDVIPAVTLDAVYGAEPWDDPLVMRRMLLAAAREEVKALKGLRARRPLPRTYLPIPTPSKRRGECDCGAIGTRDSRGECRECGQGAGVA